MGSGMKTLRQGRKIYNTREIIPIYISPKPRFFGFHAQVPELNEYGGKKRCCDTVSSPP